MGIHMNNVGWREPETPVFRPPATNLRSVPGPDDIAFPKRNKAMKRILNPRLATHGHGRAPASAFGHRGGAGHRPGVTLMELLVVMAVVVILAAAALPVMQPALEGRKIREAARMVNIALGAARIRAMETGRPAGVIFQRFNSLPQCAMLLEQAEAPPLYGGEDISSTARLRWNASGQLEASLLGAGVNTNLVKIGDRVQFNYQGPWYKIAIAPSTNLLTVVYDGPAGQLAPWPDHKSTSLSAPVPYTILCQPMKLVAPPIQLPAGAVVDLFFSGTDEPAADRFAFRPGSTSDTTPVVIMFSPSGTIDRCYHHNTFSLVTDSIHLLVGKRERVRDYQWNNPYTATLPSPEQQPNWTDLANIWVTINPQTGLVATTENARADLTSSGFAWNNYETWYQEVWKARLYAREGQSMGGR